jgi:hypothetical protein
MFARRQVAATLTTYSATSNRVYGADRWGMTNENASMQFQRIDVAGTPETGLTAKTYGAFKKITSTGKFVLSQPIESKTCQPYHGRTMRLSLKAKNGTGSHTLRFGLYYLTTSGTVDVMPTTFVSAFNAATVDPTFGTNITAIQAAKVNANATIVGTAAKAVLGSSWTQYSATFVLPTNFHNIIVMIWTDNQPVANDVVHLSEVMLNEGEDERVYMPRTFDRELQMCERFYYKTFPIDTAPAQNGGLPGRFLFTAQVIAASAGNSNTLFFRVPVRTDQNMSAGSRTTLFNPSATNAQARNERTSTDCSSTIVASVTHQSLQVTYTAASSGVIGDPLSVHVTVDTEITDQT